MYFNHRLNPKQEKAAKILYDLETKYLLFGGGAGGGKSWLGAEWGLALSMIYPGVKGFFARKEKARLKETTLKTFFKVCKEHGVRRDIDYIYQDQKGVITFHNESEILLLDVKKQPSDPDFEDLGSLEFTWGFGEEVSEWDFGAFDTLRTRIGRHHNDKYGIPPKFYLTCNPKKNWVYRTFYKPWKEGQLEQGYRFIQSLATDNPKNNKDYLDQLRAIKNEAKKQRLLHGNWEYDDDPMCLVEFDKVQDIFTNDHVDSGEKYITCDVARFGSDKTVIRVWNGWRSEKRISADSTSMTEVADMVKKEANEFRIPMSKVLVDEDGIGGGVVDILRCKGFIANSRPLKSKNNENFDNLKSQCAFLLSERINDSEVYDSIKDPDLEEIIIQELEQLKQKDLLDTRKNAIISKDAMKDNIGRSPDDLDTYIMRAFFDLQPQRNVLSSMRRR